jgi:hypothetical protein
MKTISYSLNMKDDVGAKRAGALLSGYISG